MERDGAPWLASVLRSYRNIPRQPNWLTSALPGAGWHQWGLAAGWYCYRNGHMVENGSDPVYKFYAEEATKLGLTAGYYFTHQDSGHVQGPSAAAATSVYTWPYIDGVMKERFADKNVAAVAMSKAVRPKRVSTETVCLFPPPMQLGMTALAAAASGPFYKDDPVLAGTRLKPDFVYKLPSSDGTSKRMAQTYNAISGLVETFARRLDIDPVAVLAVWYVESGGRLFTPGRPVLRFENHIFFKYWGVDHEALFDKHFQFGGHAGIPGPKSKNHRFRNTPSEAWRPVYIDSQDREYEVFALAESLGGREAACLSASFGGPQIMGFNYGVCGYPSAAAMVEAFGADQRWQVLGFYDFSRSNSLIDEIRHKQWVAFGDKYNSHGAVYGPKLKAAFDTKQALLGLPKLPNPPSDMVAVLAVRERASVKPKRAARKAKRVASKTKRAAQKSRRRASRKSKRAGGGTKRATTRTTRASTRSRRSGRRAA